MELTIFYKHTFFRSIYVLFDSQTRLLNLNRDNIILYIKYLPVMKLSQIRTRAAA